MGNTHVNLPGGGSATTDQIGAAQAIKEAAMAPSDPPVVPTFDQIDSERDRRIARGIFISLKTGKFLSVATATAEDMHNLQSATSTALALSAKTVMAVEGDPLAQPEPTMHFRDYYRNTVELMYSEMIELGTRVTDAIHQYNEAAHKLKDMTPPPADFADDGYWPNIPLPPHQESA